MANNYREIVNIFRQTALVALFSAPPKLRNSKPKIKVVNRIILYPFIPDKDKNFRGFFEILGFGI